MSGCLVGGCCVGCDCSVWFSCDCIVLVTLLLSRELDVRMLGFYAAGTLE